LGNARACRLGRRLAHLRQGSSFVIASADFREIVIEHMFVCLQLLNVQVPLFFKQIIDTLNIPIDAQSTVWVICGSVILACMWSLYLLYVVAETV
jgi:ABC-type bacteriocin/lantibiotic exporter with double-glycine peptidase domain